MNDLIGFGMAGFGMIGRTHLSAMQANLALHENSVNAAPRALYTRRPGACARLPFEKIYASLEELLGDAEVRVLDICTPNNLHFAAARAGLLAGKGVYVEKPLCHNEAGAEELRALAGQTKLPNQCALIMRFRPMVNRMKDMLEAGAVGDIIHFRVSYFHDSYLDANRLMSWRQDLAQSGGGAVMDLGIHVLDLTRYFLGEITRLRAVSRIVHKTRKTAEGAAVPNNTDEYLKADLETKKGVPGILECSRVSNSCLGGCRFEVFGTKGSILLEGEYSEKLSINEAGSGGPRIAGGGKPLERESELLPLLPGARQSLGVFPDGHAAAIKNMALWTAGLAPFSGTPTFAEAAKSQALVHACLRSAARDGQWETL